MNSRSYCPRSKRFAAREWRSFLLLAICVLFGPRSFAADAPDWMQALVNVPLPRHDEKTNAVRLYAETIVTVQPDGKIKTLEREAYKILRPDGKAYGWVRSSYDSETRVTHMRGWCIPSAGQDYRVKESDSVETALYGVENSDLITDIRTKMMQIPAAEPGNIVGYEIEHDDRPNLLQDEWIFQVGVPTREARYSLQLPPGWEYKSVWLNHATVAPAGDGNRWQWTVSDVAAIKSEEDMPAFHSVAGSMIVSFFPPGGDKKKAFGTWEEMGNWYVDLTAGRRDASPEIKQKVAALTSSAPTQLAKMQALARFVQSDIRYVAIELGIGGHQPHPASSVFSNRYGDCKDKVTLLSSMLKEIGVDSYYVVINTERGSIVASSPPNFGFNHMILAVRLPPDLNNTSLKAVMQHAKLGRILFFDPTDHLTPFGQLRGELQANYGLLVTPEGGELVELPLLPPASNQINRTATLRLDEKGTLQGDVSEVRVGDPAMQQRWALREATKATDQIKPIENVLAHAFATYQISKASVANLQRADLPFEYDYSFIASNYAKSAGGLLLVRPRVLGTKSRDILETKEPRLYPVEFEGLRHDADVFEITLPPGYEVDDLPLPVDADYGFADYHSKVVKEGNVLRYTRIFEVKQLSVPLDKMEDLKKFYRIIANDERSAAVLKPSAP